MCLNTRQTRGQNGSISFIFTSKADQVVWRSPCCWCLWRRQPQSAKSIHSWEVAIREPGLDLACHFWGEHSWHHTQAFGHHRFCHWHPTLVKTMKIRWIRKAIVTNSAAWVIVFDQPHQAPRCQELWARHIQILLHEGLAFQHFDFWHAPPKSPSWKPSRFFLLLESVVHCQSPLKGPVEWPNHENQVNHKDYGDWQRTVGKTCVFERNFNVI